jgi:hypothetical protein
VYGNLGAEFVDKAVLVEIRVSRVNGEIEYTIDCSKGLTSEELSHYLSEIIEGICAWKPEVCEDRVQTIRGKIGQTKEKKVILKNK